RAPGQGLPSARGAAGLRREVLSTIEALKPQPPLDTNARALRPYRLLQLRYVEANDPIEVQRRLAVGKSQYYREHEAALASLTALLWDRCSATALVDNVSPTPGPPGPSQAAPSGPQRFDHLWRQVSRFKLARWAAAGAVTVVGITSLLVGSGFPLRLQEPISPRTDKASLSDVPGGPPASVPMTLSVYA